MSENDPVLKALQDAAPDDEPLTEEDIAALKEAWDDVNQGRLVSHEEIRRQVLGEPNLANKPGPKGRKSKAQG